MSDIDNEKLKHCPFCGKGNSKVTIYENELTSNLKSVWWIVGCGACGSHSGTSKDKQKVIDNWNRRPHEKE